MAIFPQPSPDNIERYRVYDCVLGVQKYFSVRKLGAIKALELAKEFEEQNIEKRRIRSLISDLAINKLFTRDGKVRGLKRKRRAYKMNEREETEYLVYQISIQGKGQINLEVHLNNRRFEEAYRLMKEKIIKLHDAQPSHELTQKFKEAKRFYWNEVKR